MYTSGWPKNQNKCWNKIGSPPPSLSKKLVLKFLSVNNIVIPPAKTGNDNNNKKAVINTDQGYKPNLLKIKPLDFILNKVVIKFKAPAIEDTPAICKLKMLKSTAPPECAILPLKGG